jgi:hypothetical protein
MAKKKVMEMRWETYEAPYDNLPRLLNTIATLNPGSYYDINTYNLVSRLGKQVLQRVSYGPPWAHYLGGYQDRLLGGPLGLPGLRYTAPDGVEHNDYGGEVLD